MPGSGEKMYRVFCRWMMIALIAGWVFLGDWPANRNAVGAVPDAGYGAAPQSSASPGQFHTTMQHALAGQRAELETLSFRLSKLKQLSANYLLQGQAFESEMTGHQQLLLMSRIPLEELERTIRTNHITRRKLIRQKEDGP